MAGAVGPLAPGDVAFKLYVHDLGPTEDIEELLLQARLADDVGFDGLMISEHHLGFPGYLPNPPQVVSWILGATERVWAAPCPMLILLRPPFLVAEELAWLAVRFPDRVVAGFAAGAVAADFELAGTDMEGLTARFESALTKVHRVLSGASPELLIGDRAVLRLATHPIPVLSAASSSVAAARAGRIGCGLLLESHITPDTTRRYVSRYEGTGGVGPRVLVRRVWIGPPPTDLQESQLALYRSKVPDYNRSAWTSAGDMLLSGSGLEVADQLAAAFADSGASALNLRIHMPGVEPREARRQIELIGTDLLAPLRKRMAEAGALSAGAMQ